MPSKAEVVARLFADLDALRVDLWSMLLDGFSLSTVFELPLLKRRLEQHGSKVPSEVLDARARGRVKLNERDVVIRWCIGSDIGLAMSKSLVCGPLATRLGDRKERALRLHIDCTIFHARIIRHNLGLVGMVCRKYRGYIDKVPGLEWDDLQSLGVMGMTKGIARFDLKRGFAFSSYVTHWIRHDIGRYIQDQGRTIRIPVHLQEKASQGDTKAIDRLRVASTISLDAPRRKSGDADGDFTLRDIVPDDDDLEAELDDRLARASVERALDSLDPRSSEIMRHYYIDQWSYKKIGDSLGLSRERIRQIINVALDKLRRTETAWRMDFTDIELEESAPEIIEMTATASVVEPEPEPEPDSEPERPIPRSEQGRRLERYLQLLDDRSRLERKLAAAHDAVDEIDGELERAAADIADAITSMKRTGTRTRGRRFAPRDRPSA